MTLSTHIIVNDPVPAAKLFRHCQELLGDPEAQVWTHETWDGTPAYVNRLDQGLPAWLIVAYGADGPLPRHEDDDERPTGCVQVTFDTAYRYQAGNGAGCGDLHAWLVAQVAAWLEERGATYRWSDEYSGDWYDSRDVTHAIGDAALGALR